MINTLEERKTNLLNQIKKLNGEIDILNLPEYKKLACHRIGNIKYLGLDRFQEHSRN